MPVPYLAGNTTEPTVQRNWHELFCRYVRAKHSSAVERSVGEVACSSVVERGRGGSNTAARLTVADGKRQSSRAWRRASGARDQSIMAKGQLPHSRAGMQCRRPWRIYTSNASVIKMAARSTRAMAYKQGFDESAGVATVL